ncbi:hypothetical protein GNI_046160 [Gregarina niphandrodes]|uniref:Uncharacterized protein n=1 Tax=Gregarina niphandrodes TaxID=110365 RepID=A0A023B9S5_GRENI|nr:hypothetical protein GNI_046160 [Gregarina niphandrodes]EZG75640.1 hypothetical protein GNI_046160 [Gregarina niphandrodes]|eukprot:XP_011129604.1 hypothetical protein GNI_046160 [Gregarina niphandrodes]
MINTNKIIQYQILKKSTQFMTLIIRTLKMLKKQTLKNQVLENRV